MSCSARLPVYVLLTSLLFAGQPLYAAASPSPAATCSARSRRSAAPSVFRRTLLKGDGAADGARAADLQVAVADQRAASPRRIRAWRSCKTAGTVIMAICIVMWWLSAYPQVPPPEAQRRCARRRPRPSIERGAAAPRGDEADAARGRASQRGASPDGSAALVQPVFAPLGYDWQLTVGVLTSFLAREVFVSTMSVLRRRIGRCRRATRRDRAHPQGARATTARRCSRRRRRRACWCSSCWRCSACRRWR